MGCVGSKSEGGDARRRVERRTGEESREVSLGEIDSLKGVKEGKEEIPVSRVGVFQKIVYSYE